MCPSLDLPSIEGRFETEKFSFLRVSVKGCNQTELDLKGKQCLDFDQVDGKLVNLALVKYRPVMEPYSDDKLVVLDSSNYQVIDTNYMQFVDFFIT